MHDVILLYSRQDGAQTFNTPHEPATASSVKRWKGRAQKVTFDESGNRNPTLKVAEQAGGVAMGSVWSLPLLAPVAKERLGYPTQKPLALLERIIAASSNPGDVVLDPFCGSGTTLHAAQRLGRQWIGIDSGQHAIDMAKRRLVDAFPDISVEFLDRAKP